MTDTLFEVVFQGKLADGFSASDVKANIARLFKATPQQVEQMFSGRRVVIRNQLDQETALKYQALLRKNGAICTTEAMKRAETPAPAPQPATPPVSASAPSRPVATERPAPRPEPAHASSAPKAPASESGRLNLAGRKVDTILSGVHLDVAPAGTTLSSGSDQPAPEAPDTSHLSIAPVGVTLVEQPERPPAITPDIDHLSLAPPGARLSDPEPDE